MNISESKFDYPDEIILNLRTKFHGFGHRPPLPISTLDNQMLEMELEFFFFIFNILMTHFVPKTYLLINIYEMRDASSDHLNLYHGTYTRCGRR